MQIVMKWAAAAMVMLGSALVALGQDAVPANEQQKQLQRQRIHRGAPAVTPVTRDNSLSLVRAVPAGERTKVAYLGVHSSPAQPALQRQLQLKPGIGLVVDSVAPGSPAEKAGLTAYDVLHKLDDQILINTEQLDVLVRSYGSGKEVKITIIREGKSQIIAARLAEREMEPMRLTLGANPYASPAVERALEYVNLNRQPNSFFENDALEPIEIKTPDGKQQLRAARVTIEGERHTMILFNQDGRKHLKVHDKAGEVLFEGPIETKEELDKVPAELRQTFEEIMVDYSPHVEQTTTQPTEKLTK